MRRLLAALLGAWLVGAAPAGAQSARPDGEAVLLVNQKPVLVIGDAGGYSGETRAMIVRDRIRRIVAPSPGHSFRPVGAQDVTLAPLSEVPVIRLRDQDLLTVASGDAEAAGVPARVLAERWVAALRSALADVSLNADQELPADFVTVSAGGGAGAAPKGEVDRFEPEALPLDLNQPPLDRPRGP